MPDLATIWFLLVGVLIVGYVVLDGFDLGAGTLHLFVARNDHERRTVIGAVGPFWDGNEVWLLTGGGALFAAFPIVYATVFSGFYLALILLLVALILRAVAIEFRSHLESPRWRATWDVIFALGSFLPILLLGVAIGNVVRGLPLDAAGDYRGGLVGLLNPYALVVGLLAVAVLVAHGGAWLSLKVNGPIAARARAASRWAWLATVALWLVAGAFTMIEGGAESGHLPFGGREPVALLVPAAFLVLSVAFRRFLDQPGRELAAFLASAGSIAALVAHVGIALYPNLVPALDAPDRSLTVANASSSDLTLTVMLVIALIGVPIVLAYTAWIYRTFRGKLHPDEGGY